MNRKMENLINY